MGNTSKSPFFKLFVQSRNFFFYKCLNCIILLVSFLWRHIFQLFNFSNISARYMSVYKTKTALQLCCNCMILIMHKIENFTFNTFHHESHLPLVLKNMFWAHIITQNLKILEFNGWNLIKLTVFISLFKRELSSLDASDSWLII